jgi:hypothetical protein
MLHNYTNIDLLRDNRKIALFPNDIATPDDDIVTKVMANSHYDVQSELNNPIDDV